MNGTSSGVQSKLEWLESMKKKHEQHLSEINGNRIKKLKREITKKALRAIEQEDGRDGINSNSLKNTNRAPDDSHKRKQTERQRIFAKHINMNASFPKTAREYEIEKKMDEAIKNNNSYQMDHLNKQLMDIHLHQVLKEAEKKTRYELKISKKKDKHKPMLDWKFTKKERWERKGNSCVCFLSNNL